HRVPEHTGDVELAHRDGLPPGLGTDRGKPGPTEVDGIPIPSPKRIRLLCRQEFDPRYRSELWTRCPPVPGRDPPLPTLASPRRGFGRKIRRNSSILAECSKGPPSPQIVAREARDVRERRDPKFEFPKTSNFGPRTVVRLACPACLARLSC